MNKRISKKRLIYSNYDLMEMRGEVVETLKEEGNENPTEEEIYNAIIEWDEILFDDLKHELRSFVNGSKWILQGYIGRWDGKYHGGFIFDNADNMIRKVLSGCDYYEFYDENGHFYIKCSHHDGTNIYEVKKVTAAGNKYIERWEENWNDKRKEEYVHNKVMERYSTLPHFLHIMYGSPKYQYEK